MEIVFRPFISFVHLCACVNRQGGWLVTSVANGMVGLEGG